MRFRKCTSFMAALVGASGLVQPASAFTLYDFKHIVVIYEENHSFDNLYGLWGNVNGQPVNGLPFADPAHTTQIRQDNVTPYTCLLQKDVNLTSPSPLPTTCVDNTGTPFNSAFVNAPFNIGDFIAPTDTTCPAPGVFAANGILKGSGLPGGCTRDMVHRYYNEQYQIDGGRQDRYVTASDAAGLSMGYYDTTTLPIYAYLHAAGAPNYVIADNFFQGAFGGSFLNHQWLIAAQAPKWDTSQRAVPAGKNSVVDAAGFPNSGYPLYKPDPAVSYVDGPLTQACGQPSTIAGYACGNYAVNTMQPSWPPSAFGSNVLPGINDVDPSKPFYETNIGDELSAKNISWNWYAGGWNDAVAGHPDPLFQYHHQPLNYFQNYAPGMPGRAHMRDETEFVAAAQGGTLPAVSFVKPVGEENEHPGYASTDHGDSHLVELLKTILGGPDGKNTLVVVTYDEFGGQWDHVAPPGQGPTAADGPSDQFGPSTRIPALIIGGTFTQSGVDHQAHDTTSILATVERQYGLAPLGPRDKQVTDLRHALIVGGNR